MTHTKAFSLLHFASTACLATGIGLLIGFNTVAYSHAQLLHSGGGTLLAQWKALPNEFRPGPGIPITMAPIDRTVETQLVIGMLLVLLGFAIHFLRHRNERRVRVRAREKGAVEIVDLQWWHVRL